MFWEELAKEYHRLAASSKDQIIEFAKKFSQIYFLWSKFFLAGQNEYIFKKELYIICNTNIFV